MFGASPRPMHILVKKEMFKGFLGRVLRASGQLPVDRSGDRAALQLSKDVLDAGRCVGILPEGTRGSGAGNGHQQRGGLAGAELRSTGGPGGHPGHPDGRRTPRHRSQAGPAAPRQLRRTPSRSAASPAKPGVLQWTGREWKSALRWQGTSRTPFNSAGSPCPTRIPAQNFNSSSRDAGRSPLRKVQ